MTQLREIVGNKSQLVRSLTTSKEAFPPFTKKRGREVGRGRKAKRELGLGRVALTETGRGLKENLTGIFLLEPSL